MKFIKQHNGFKKNGKGSLYLSECGRVELTLYVSSESVPITDGRWTVGYRTRNFRWYSVRIRGDVFGLSADEFFEPMFFTVKTLKDAKNIGKRIRESNPCMVYWPEADRRPTLYMEEGVKDSTRLKYNVVDLPVNI